MLPISFARHRFPPDVIRHAVWLYLRFTLSYRDVEDLLAERGLMISNVSNRVQPRPPFGVRPSGRTGSGFDFDPLPGVAILKLLGAQISQCGM